MFTFSSFRSVALILSLVSMIGIARAVDVQEQNSDRERGIQLFKQGDVNGASKSLRDTERARLAGITGTVILRAVFASDGAVKYILAIRSLPYGLTERAIEAARKIKFTPATKDGRQVSMVLELQYNFNLY